MLKSQNPFALDFDTYILQSEPFKQQKSKLWQIHPFGDALVPEGINVNNFHSCKRRGAVYGNTRTTAVFTIKYLNSLGFKVNNEPFEKNSWYFRNSLVRANYTNMTKGIFWN
ncbi:MAG: hypothetical protein MJZ50_09240 [Treponema sp.]|nr:hypothetical protein [Treponema sp.]